MHELSLCGAIADIVNRHRGDRRVDAVHVRVGQLRQVVPDTLAYCWSLTSEDTDLAGSRLVIEHVSARISCHDCGSAHEVGQFPILVCGTCGSGHVRVDAGEEFLITSLDLAEA